MARSYDSSPQLVRRNGVLQVFFDASGQPYHQTTSGERRYIDPRQAAQGDPNAAAGSDAARLQDWARTQGVNITRNETGGGSMTNPTAYQQPNWMNTRTVWNPTSGRFERDIDRTFLATLAGAGGVIGAGGAAALAGGGSAVAPLAGGANATFQGANAALPGVASTFGGTAAGTTAAGLGSGTVSGLLGTTPAYAGGGTAATPAAIQSAAQGTGTLPGAANPLFQSANVQAPGAGMLPNASTASGWQDWLKKEGIEDIGEFVRGIGRGAGDERNAENLWRQSRDSTLAQIARDQALFDLQGAQSTYDRNRLQQNDIFDTGMRSATFGRENQSREMRQSLLSGLIGGAEDFKITGNINPNIAARIPTTTGGLRPSMLNNSRESILATLGRPQVQAPTYTPPTPYAPPTGYRPPTLSDYERASGGETAANWIGAGAKVAAPIIRRFW